MKKIISSGIVIVFLLVIITLNLSSCGQTPPPQTYPITDVSNFNHKISTALDPAHLPLGSNGWGIRFFDWDGNWATGITIQYSGQPLKYFVSLTNYNKVPDHLGLVLFIDGRIQPFLVDDQEAPVYMYDQIVPEYSLINIPITYTPTIETLNMHHYLEFMMVYQLDVIPNDTILHVDGGSLGYRSDLIFTQNDGDNYTEIISTGNIIPIKSGLKGQSFTVAIYKNDFNPGNHFNQQTRITVRKGETVRFRYEAISCAGPDTKLYSTTLFLDHKAVKAFDGNDYLVWQCNGDQMLYQEFDLKIPDQPGEYQLYALSCSLDKKSDTISLNSSEKSILVVTD